MIYVNILEIIYTFQCLIEVIQFFKRLGSRSPILSYLDFGQKPAVMVALPTQ